MYTLKRGVMMFQSDEIEKLFSVIVPVFSAFKLPVVVTSGLDGPHRSGSLHYRSRAIDVRKNFANAELSAIWRLHGSTILGAMRDRARILGYPIDVIDETDHVHIEWDEKK